MKRGWAPLGSRVSFRPSDYYKTSNLTRIRSLIQPTRHVLLQSVQLKITVIGSSALRVCNSRHERRSESHRRHLRFGATPCAILNGRVRTIGYSRRGACSNPGWTHAITASKNSPPRVMFQTRNTWSTEHAHATAHAATVLGDVVCTRRTVVGFMAVIPTYRAAGARVGVYCIRDLLLTIDGPHLFLKGFLMDDWHERTWRAMIADRGLYDIAVRSYRAFLDAYLLDIIANNGSHTVTSG